MIPPAIRALAEDPSAFGPDPPPESGTHRVLTDRFCFLRGPFFTSVSRLRLAPDDVEPALAEVRRLAGAQEWPTAWWVGESATPPDLSERLLALGLRRATDPSWEPVGTAMATVTPPPAAPGVDAQRVATFEEFARANEIGWECFELPEDERARHRGALPERWEAERTGLAPAVFMARVDGEPVAAGRGTPALVTTAGAMSRPILERLGFEPVARIEILLDG